MESTHKEMQVQKHTALVRTGAAWERGSPQLCQACKNIPGAHHQGKWHGLAWRISSK